jgi:putative transposase
VKVLARFAASGLEVEAFCAHEGLSVSSFRRWRNLLAAEVPSAADLPPGQASRAALSMRALLGGQGRLDLRLDLGGGVILHLSRG